LTEGLFLVTLVNFTLNAIGTVCKMKSLYY